MEPQVQTDIPVGRARGWQPAALETATASEAPGAAAWVRVQAAPSVRLGRVAPRKVVVAGVAWEGRDHTVSVDPVLVVIVVAELALVGAGLLGKLVLAALL